jgi:putative flippase GtrA
MVNRCCSSIAPARRCVVTAYGGDELLRERRLRASERLKLTGCSSKVCWFVPETTRSRVSSSPMGLIAYARTEEARKKLRYCGVSTIFVPFGQINIQVFGLWLDSYTAASLLSAAVVTIPNFFANKHFVWRVTSRENLRRQMLVFWVAMMLGVSLATLFTHFIEIALDDRTQLVRGAAVFLAQLVGYGIVWVGRFLLLNRWLFKLPDHPSPHDAQLIGDGSKT